MARARGLIPYHRARGESEIQEQLWKVVDSLNRFSFLGVLSSDPTTTGWGAEDLCWWVNIATPTTAVIKFWNGAAVRTVTTS